MSCILGMFSADFAACMPDISVRLSIFTYVLYRIPMFRHIPHGFYETHMKGKHFVSFSNYACKRFCSNNPYFNSQNISHNLGVLPKSEYQEIRKQGKARDMLS